jgi:hypothetical protein
MPRNNVKIQSYYSEFEPEESEIATGNKAIRRGGPLAFIPNFLGRLSRFVRRSAVESRRVRL